MNRPHQYPPRRSAWTARAGFAAAAILLVGLGVAVGRLIPDNGPATAAGLAAAGRNSPRVNAGDAAPQPAGRGASVSASASAATSQASPLRCTNPQFVTSAPTGGWSDGDYYIYNNMWNSTRYSVQQTLYACSYSDWYVVANMNNDSGDGAVKTDPNVQMNFNEPAISSFHSISSTFAESSPNGGIYNDAYDVWINGVDTSGSSEVMIWNQNHGQTPAGSVVAMASLGGRTYQVWKYGGYIAFVAQPAFSSGTVNLLAFFDYVVDQGYIAANSTLGQIDYGVELVSTNGTPATFTFTNFSVTAS